MLLLGLLMIVVVGVVALPTVLLLPPLMLLTAKLCSRMATARWWAAGEMLDRVEHVHTLSSQLPAARGCRGCKRVLAQK